MTGRPSPPVPGGYERAYADSYGLAFDRLAQADLAEICHKSGAVLVDRDAVGLTFLNRECRIDRRLREVVPRPDDQPVPTAEKLLILHYLITARGAPPRGELVSFQELPEGMAYYPTFYQRAIGPLLRAYGRSPERLVAAAARLGGRAGTQGDAEVTLRAFPRVDLTWILWRGDEEFPAAGTVLMDRGIQDYLPAEDIVVLCQRTAIRLSLAG